MNKICRSLDEAVADIPDGASIAMDSWAIAATAQNLIAALKRKGTRDLTVITHCFIPMIFGEDTAVMPAVLLPQMKKLITPVVGIPHLGGIAFVEEYVNNGLEIEQTTIGTMSSRLYAGAVRMGGFYNPVGVGTVIENGKEKRVIEGQEYIFEKPIKPDYAFIRARKADKLGNLIYKGVFRGDQPVMAMAAKFTIAEVDEIVEPGEIDAENVVTAGIFVDRVVKIPEDGLGTDRKLKEVVYALYEIEPARKLMWG
ncbi:MAG: CoA transferase subunit A [Dehalococcoidia bacterium]|nr:CoA transferase subunit A [Dehalococcoidia bacterium]